jgi:hypothetical protein
VWVEYSPLTSQYCISGSYDTTFPGTSAQLSDPAVDSVQEPKIAFANSIDATTLAAVVFYTRDLTTDIRTIQASLLTLRLE